MMHGNVHALFSHLASETIIRTADGTEEIVHVIVVDAPAGAIWSLTVKRVVPSIVLRLSNRLREMLLVDFCLHKLKMYAKR